MFHDFIIYALPVLTIIRQVATVIQQRVQVMPQCCVTYIHGSLQNLQLKNHLGSLITTFTKSLMHLVSV